MGSPAIFFDKDGTLIKNVPYNARAELVELNDGAARSIRILKEAGHLLFVVSNQPGVGKGLFTESDLGEAWARLNDLCGSRLDGFYFCPHLASDACRCRKPATGLLLRAASENDLDLRNSWLVGDILDDIESGNRAGCRTILLDNGGETEWLTGPSRVPDHTVGSLSEAAEIILRNG